MSRTTRTPHSAAPPSAPPLPSALLVGPHREMPWRPFARCADLPREMFFPERGESSAPGKRACAGCPVRFQCLEHALNNDERFGIWGGLSYRERRRLLRVRPAA